MRWVELCLERTAHKIGEAIVQSQQSGVAQRLPAAAGRDAGPRTGEQHHAPEQFRLGRTDSYWASKGRTKSEIKI